MLNPEPYWWDAVPRTATDLAPLPKTVDVAIVGSGYTGLSAALTLARAGRSAAVFEKDRLGEGASTRNGGMASGGIRMRFSRMIELFGEADAAAIYGEGVAARDDLARFLETEKIDCDFAKTGQFYGLCQPAHYDGLAREADLLNRHFDIGAAMVAKADQQSEIGTDFYHGGMTRPDIGGLHPGKFHDGLLACVRATDAQIHGQTEVTGIARDGDRFEVRTARGIVSARDVIVATNGYTGGALSWLYRRIIAVPSQIIVTEPIACSLMDRLMPKRRMIGETRNMYHYYRPSPVGTRIVFGGRAGAHSDDPKVKYRHLRRNLLELFPDLHDVAISHSWWGYTGFTFDFLPKIAVEDGVHYAAGYCGSGVVWARWIGARTAQRILGLPEAQSVFAQRAFQTRPLYCGRPWFLPAVVAWYSMMDRIGR